MVRSEPFCFSVWNSSGICGFENSFKGVSVGKCVFECLVVGIVYLVCVRGIAQSASLSPCVIHFGCIVSIVTIIICRNRIVGRYQFYLIFHLGNIFCCPVFVEYYVKNVSLRGFNARCNSVPKSFCFVLVESLGINTGSYDSPVATRSTATGTCVATDTNPLCCLIGREVEIAHCVNNVLEFAVNIDVRFAFFLVPNTYNVVVNLRFGYNAGCCPNPVVCRLRRNVGKERDFVLALTAYSSNKESCTSGFHCREPFCFCVLDRRSVVSLEQGLHCVSVGKSFLIPVVVKIIDFNV